MFPVPRQGGICFFVSRSLLRAAALPHATATRAGSSPSKEAVADHPRRQALCGQRASKEGGRARCYIHSSPGCWQPHSRVHDEEVEWGQQRRRLSQQEAVAKKPGLSPASGGGGDAHSAGTTPSLSLALFSPLSAKACTRGPRVCLHPSTSNACPDDDDDVCSMQKQLTRCRFASKDGRVVAPRGILRVTSRVGNQKWSASRLVLTAQSKFLAALFDGGLK